jgi:aminoglycoside phosphotransferase (APT) family kinase protein
MDTVEELCAELASFAIPETLEHSDLDAGNIFLCDGRPVLTDWSDSSVSHPFFTMALMERAGVPSGPRLDAYLRQWSAFETEVRLRRAYSVARPLAALDRAIHYLDDIVPNTDNGVDRREMEAIMSSYARMAVKSLEPWS